jgi:hypothetical protein
MIFGMPRFSTKLPAREPVVATHCRLTRAAAVREILAECEQEGIVEDVREALGAAKDEARSTSQLVRDLVYELAAEKNRDLAVDALIYATGIAEYDLVSLRDYARKHGFSAEGFRKHVLALQQRLGLPKRPHQFHSAN